MALSFDGTDDYLVKEGGHVFNDSGFSSTNYSFSFSCWIRPDGRHIGGVFEQYDPDNPSGDGRIGIYLLSNGRIRFRFHNSYINSNTYHISTSTTTWYHLVGFWEYGERGFYVNGSVSDYTSSGNTGDKSSDHSNSTVDFAIGRAYQGAPGAASFFNGDIAECAAWKVKLTESEISSLAAGFSPQLVRPSESLGYWPLGGAYSDYIDPIGQNTLSVTGDPAAADHPRIIYPTGFLTFDYAAPVVEEEEEVATVKGFVFESMQMTLTQGGRRRYNVADSPTASTNKGWSFESLQAMITQGGARRK